MNEEGGDERAFDPIKIKVPEDEFIAALVAFMFEYAEVPMDGKWREIVLHFDIRSTPGDDRITPPQSGFMLGGRNAG